MIDPYSSVNLLAIDTLIVVMRKILLLLVLVSMLLTACSSPAKEDGAKQKETSSTSTSTTSTTAIDPARDRQRSEAIVLTAEDLPGWTSEQPDQAVREAEVVDLATRAAACRPAGISDESWDGGGKEFFGPTLAKGTETVESSVTFLPSKETGIADIAALRDEASRQCGWNAVKQLVIDDVIASGDGQVTEDDVDIDFSVRPLALEGFGANTVAERVVVTATFRDFPLEARLVTDIVMTVHDRAMITIGYSAEDDEPDIDLERELVQKIRTKAIKAIRSQAV